MANLGTNNLGTYAPITIRPSDQAQDGSQRETPWFFGRKFGTWRGPTGTFEIEKIGASVLSRLSLEKGARTSLSASKKPRNWRRGSPKRTWRPNRVRYSAYQSVCFRRECAVIAGLAHEVQILQYHIEERSHVSKEGKEEQKEIEEIVTV